MSSLDEHGPAARPAVPGPAGAGVPGAVPMPPRSQSERARPSSGTVAAALDELAGIAQRPLGEHPDAYGRVHAGLQRALSELDDA